jgi:hypothetical protein
LPARVAADLGWPLPDRGDIQLGWRGGVAAHPQVPFAQFYVDLNVAAEPRIVLSQSGPIKLVEALTDQGEALLGAEPAVQSNKLQEWNDMMNSRSQSTLRQQVFLKYPAKPASSIRRLRGTLPVTLASRRDEPTEIVLAEAKGKTHDAGDMMLTIVQVGVPENNQPPGTAIEMILRPRDPALSQDPGLVGNAVQLIFARTLQMPQNQIEIVDAEGRPCRWFPSGSNHAADQIRITIQVQGGQGGVGPPERLRYYSMIRAETEVAFDFSDIPLP